MGIIERNIYYLRKLTFLLKVLGLSFAISLLIVKAADGQDADDTASFANFSHYVRLQQSYVAMIKCDASSGSCFIARLPNVHDIVFAITNRHVLENGGDVTISIPFGNEAGVDTTVDLKMNIEFFEKPAKIPVRSGATITWGGLDIAVILVTSSSLKGIGWPELGSLRVLEPENFTKWSDLIPGQTVTFVGFPLGKKIAQKYPFIRTGVVAGFDQYSDTIFVDGQFFDGSSGSPVFLDRRDPACALPMKSGRYFVGVVSGYEPYKKLLLNAKTKKVEMIQTENSGIGIVIPSSTLYDMLLNLER